MKNKITYYRYTLYQTNRMGSGKEIDRYTAKKTAIRASKKLNHGEIYDNALDKVIYRF